MHSKVHVKLMVTFRTLSTNINRVQETGDQANRAHLSGILSRCCAFKGTRNIWVNSLTLSTNINGGALQEAGEQANSVLSSAAPNSPRFPGHVYGGTRKRMAFWGNYRESENIKPDAGTGREQERMTR